VPALWMLFASFAFALMGACVKLAALHYSIAEIVFYRGLVGVAVLFLMARASGRSLRTATPAAHLWRGALGVASLWFWFAAITRLPLATAVTLNYMSPIWTAALVIGAAWWCRSSRDPGRTPWQPLAAILVSFLGVVLVLRPAFAADAWAGGLMALASGMLAAVAYILVRRLSRMGEPEDRVVFYFSLVNVAAGLLVVLVLPGGWHAHGWQGAALLIGVGISGTAGQVALTRAYRLGRTLVVANLQYSGIVFSSALGILVWGDRLDGQVLLGMGVIFGSCIAASYYNLRAGPPAATVLKSASKA
jgi:S-adenosylmethionine uptake transporter